MQLLSIDIRRLPKLKIMYLYILGSGKYELLRVRHLQEQPRFVLKECQGPWQLIALFLLLPIYHPQQRLDLQNSDRMRNLDQ